MERIDRRGNPEAIRQSIRGEKHSTCSITRRNQTIRWGDDRGSPVFTNNSITGQRYIEVSEYRVVAGGWMLWLFFGTALHDHALLHRQCEHVIGTGGIGMETAIGRKKKGMVATSAPIPIPV